jgi:hypothetical protein
MQQQQQQQPAATGAAIADITTADVANNLLVFIS